MKRLISAIVLLVFIELIFIGCSDTLTPPDQSSQSFLQKEGNGEGAGILRYEAENYYIFLDFEAQLLLFIGVNDVLETCNGTGGFDIMKFKELLLPNADPELRRLIMQINCGDAAAIVWQASDWPANLCDFALSTEPLAIGTVNFRYTDNDFNAWWQEHPNSNPFGYKANGSLVGLNGEEYNLNFIDRINWDWETTKWIENFKIHLIPRGN